VLLILILVARPQGIMGQSEFNLQKLFGFFPGLRSK